MDSNYVKDLEEEIKKSKAENNLQFDIDQMNDQKGENENSDLAQSQHQFEQEEEIEQEQEQEQDQDQDQNEFEQSQNNNNFEEEEDNDLVNEGIKSLVSDDNKKNEQIEENINYDLQEMNEPKTNSKFPNLISMNSFSVCQCCNKEFDSKKNIPYLLKCNHFFCKTCLENYFTDEEGIKCPIDGLVGKSLNDIKIMKNFVDNKNNDKSNKNNVNKKSDKKNVNKNNIIGNNGKELKNIMNKNMNKNKENNINLNMFNNNNNNDNNIYDDNENENFNENSNTNNENNNLLKPQYSSNKKKSGTGKKSLKKNFSQNNNNKNDNAINNNNNINNLSNINNNNLSNNNLNEKEAEENIDDSPGAEEYSQNFCNIHPEQKITHFVEDTKELICIHCAFNKLKNNPTILIKEISEKCKEYLNDLDNIIDNNQKYSQIIQNSLNDINENKENEEKKIIEIYEQLLNLLVTNRNNFLIKIEEIYQENTGNMNKKLENFSEIIDIAEKLKEDFEAIADQAPYEFNHLTQAFNKFIREMNDKSKSDLDIIQYNFSHDELNKVLRYLNNFSDVKTRKKCFRFDFLKNNGSQNYAIREINNFSNYNNYNNLINRNVNMTDNSNNNIFNNGINKYYKASKGLSYINFNNSNNNNNMMSNNMNIIPQKNLPNILTLKNDSMLEGSNSNVRFNFKYNDSGNKESNRYLTNNNNNNNNNNFNGNSISESINATLNKYIIPNNINNNRDNYFSNKTPLRNFQNSGNISNNSNNNSGIQGNFKENDKLAILNKYKIPSKKK